MSDAAPTINIQVPRAVRHRIGEIAEENGGLKLLAVVGILVRGWDLLGPEQQTRAIRQGRGDAESLATPLGRTPDHDLRSELARLVAGSASLNVLVADALADGELDARERRQVRSGLKQVLRHIDGAAQLAQC